MAMTDWQAKRKAEMDCITALRDSVDLLDEEVLQRGVLEALRALPDSSTRTVLGHCVLELSPDIHTDQTLIFLGLAMDDMDENPHRYGAMGARVLRAKLERWALPALGERLKEAVDSAAKWRYEYETNPEENDNIGDIFACLESRGMERASARGDANDPGYEVRCRPGFKAEDVKGWESWDVILDWIKADDERRVHFGDWAVGHSDTYRAAGMYVLDGIEVDSYSPGEVQDQLDLEFFQRDLEDLLGRKADLDWIKLGFFTEQFEPFDCYVDKDDLTSDLSGDYPRVDIFVDCGYERIVVWVGEDLLEEWWKDFNDVPTDDVIDYDVWDAIADWVKERE